MRRNFFLASAALGASSLFGAGSTASAGLLDFKLTGAGAGNGVVWQSESTIDTLENQWTAGQGDWIWANTLTTNSQGLANLLVDKPWWDSSSYAGTSLGIKIGAGGSNGNPGTCYQYVDAGAPIFSYTGSLSSNYNRPYNATFTTGTWTLDTYVDGHIQQATLTVAAPETSTWAMMGVGFVGLGLAGALASRKRAAFVA